MSRDWTKMPYFCGKRAFFNTMMRGILVILCPVMLSACGESTPRGYSGSPGSDTLKPVAAPPGADEQPTLAGMTGTPKTPDGLPALTAKGTNTALFSAKLSDEADRLDRLENAVQELRNDFDAMAPAIVRLVSIEKDLQNLISQLDMLTNGAAASSIPPIEESALAAAEPIQPADVPLPPAPVDITPTDEPVPPTADPVTPPPAQQPATPPAPAAEIPQAAAPAASPAPVVAPVAAPAVPPATHGITVTAIRIGEHPDKVRIVLDIKGKTNYKADLDNEENILVIELDNAGWTAQAQQSFPASHPLFSSYRTEKMGDNGTMMVLQLKKSSSILYKAAMDDAGAGTSKIVIDLKK